MPDSDKHLISDSSALSKLISPVSSPRQKLLLSQVGPRSSWEDTGCGRTHGARGSTEQGPSYCTRIVEQLIRAILPPPSLMGQSSEYNGWDRITGWDHITLFISASHACCENDCPRCLSTALLVVSTADFAMWVLGCVADTSFGCQVLSRRCRTEVTT